MSEVVALDLFAGTGWGVACKRLGIEEYGVELMEEAVQTRTANGMETIYRDVWEGLLLSAEAHELLYGAYSLLIASPPCQTFSAAGNGAGRKALNEVLEAIRQESYKDPAALRAFGELHDMRTALVLTPLAYIWRDKPQYVVLEQVPTVQPVWEEYARVMREWGYSVETRILNAEQYGVPQTRRRSILVANLAGPISLPTPTHSRYYPRDPKRLDPGVLPWVSMAQALGWGMTARPYLTVTGGGDRDGSKHTGDPVPSALGSAGSRARVTSEREAGRWIWPDDEGRQLMTPSGELKMLASELAAIQTYPPTDVHFTQNNRQANQARRSLDQPAPTVTAGHDYNNRGFLREDGTVLPATTDQVAALQSYPAGVVGFPRLSDGGGEIELDGVAYRSRDLRDAEHPSQVVTAKARSWNRYTADGVERIEVEEAAALQSYPTAVKSMGAGMVERHGDRPGREGDQPAFTIRASAGGTEPGGFKLEHEGQTRKLEPEEAATLQSYPPGVVYRNGNQANAARRTPEQPAPTVHFGQRLNKVEWMSEELAGDPAASGVPVSPEEAAALQTYPVELRQEIQDWAWLHAPATTVTGDNRITAREHHHPGEQGKTALKLETGEATVLQTYPEEPKFVWCGSRSKVFLQIGNAVPPLLAQAILAEVLILS